MRIIARGTLRDFWENKKFQDSEQPLRAWFAEVEQAKWKNQNEIKAQYANASIIGNNKVVFNIKGNDYRLIVAIRFDFQIVYIRFIGTHAQYDKINALEV
jgi:mRNA interferase HigB